MSAYGILFSLLTVYFVEFSIPTEIFSTILFINTAIGIVVAPLFGWAADKYNLKIIILFGALCFVFGTLLLITGSLDLFLLVSVMVLTGLGNVMMGTAAPIYITTQSERVDTGEILGVFWSALSLGWIVGPLVGGGVATFFGSLISSFVFALILFSAALIIAFWFVKSN